MAPGSCSGAPGRWSARWRGGRKRRTGTTSAAARAVHPAAMRSAWLHAAGPSPPTAHQAQAQQVKNVQQRLQESDKLSAGVEDMMKRLMKTVEDSQKYSQSVAKLTENVSQLNTIYGNMLSAMGSVVNGR